MPSQLLFHYLLTPFLISLISLPFSSSIPLSHSARQTTNASCPPIHVFGACETTASPGYGSAGTVVNSILSAHSGATAEAIDYPAAGGDSYGTSVQAGVQAVTDQVNSFVEGCPDAEVVLVGYSQVNRVLQVLMDQI